ncbi:hypothetical protein WJX77_008492 [Trebouxia sp. C0004]
MSQKVVMQKMERERQTVMGSVRATASQLENEVAQVLKFGAQPEGQGLIVSKPPEATTSVVQTAPNTTGVTQPSLGGMPRTSLRGSGRYNPGTTSFKRLAKQSMINQMLFCH